MIRRIRAESEMVRFSFPFVSDVLNGDLRSLLRSHKLLRWY